MLRNYLKILLRNFARNRAFTLINISGLTLGITCSLIMFMIVKEELSFNQYHSKLDRIYRVGHIDYIDGNEYPGGGVPLPMRAAVAEDIVGLTNSTLISHESYGLISVTGNDGDVQYYEESPELVYVQPSFFEMFDWKVLEGAVAEAFKEPNKAALSETMAKKYFPDESAIGKTIRLNKNKDLLITAVLEDARKDSDFPFGIFMSMETKGAESSFTRWGSISSNDVLFVELDEATTAVDVDNQFPDFVEKYWSKEEREERSFLLAPFSEYHFDDRFGTFSRSSSKQMLWTYAAIGIFLIVTACFNFINMSTAMAVKRAKEVGMRKVLGSSRKQLVMRFLGETFAITFLSLLVSIALTERLIPLVINEFFDLEINFSLLSDLSLILYLVGVLVLVSLLAGLYPAFVLSGAKPIYALKGALDNKGSNMTLRRVLVVFQFFLCQLLIFGTIVAVKQMNYFSNVDMGYEKENIMFFRMAENDLEKQKLWKSRIADIPGVKVSSVASHPPFSGSVMGTNAYYYTDDTTRQEIDIQFKRVDEAYQETYGLRMLAGDWVVKSDTMSQFVVNQSFLIKAGVKDPVSAIGETVNVWGRKFPIVGVVEDYHATTLSDAIEPMVMFSDAGENYTVGLKINAERTEEIVSALEEIWLNFHEEYEFDYRFVDEEIAAFYENEKKMSQLLTSFAGISIFIGCLGLYGLVAFMANQKSKEIGIRKVLGATVPSLVGNFSGEFAKLVGLAFLVAAPLGYLGMNTWLQEYEYSISIGPLIFISTIIASMLIAMFTTGYRSLRAATANPVNSLRDE
ncbi:ABC transporter permease [Roseivirga sp. E12]|uniref:ABC transporter permease n=1 Tax=Roseivirga sp. E12 TaxID=2819237 RepID=UPI001ABC7CF3|nr:ABC transporter permease [Roseivirga sp. E12]MBO3700662.1 ABC transporter permease [Roseivirga sp. E12]